MAVRLTGSFFDINSHEYRVDIHDVDHVGASYDFDVKFCNINYDSERSDDPTGAMIGSRCEVGITVPYQDATLLAFIEDFAEGAENRFFVEITKVLTSLTIWRGILTPDFTGEEDTAPLFVFKVSAVCGLGTLKKKPYHDGTAIYTGIDRFTKHITRALSAIAHTDTFWSGTDAFLKTAVDWWAVSMASGADDDALHQGGVDHSAFYDYATQGSIDKDVLSMWDVLWHILKSFNCRIYQNEGVWWVEQIPYRTASPYYTRAYEKDGDFIASATNSGANIIDQTKTGAKLATMNYDFLPALEKAEVNYDVKIRRNFLNGQNLTAGFDTINFDQNISSNGGDAICRIKGQISFGVKNLSYSGGANDVLFLVPNFRLKIGSNYLKRSYTVSNFNAIIDPPEWTAVASDVVAIPHNLGPVVPVGSTMNGTINFEILAPALPSDGDDNQFLMEVQDMVKWNGGGVSNSEFQIFWSASSLFLEIYDEGTPVVAEDQVLYTATNPETFSEVYETTVRIGTATLPNSAGRVMRWNGTIWVLADLWGQGVGTRNKALGDLLALNILNARLTPLRRLNGTLYGDFRMHRLLNTTDGKKWMFSNVQWDLGGNTMQGTWFELDYGTAGVSATPIKKKVIQNGPTFPPTTDPTNPNGLTNTSSGFNINPAPTVLAPVAYNQLDGEIDEGDTVTSIPIKISSTGAEFLAGDGVTLVNPYTGEFQTFTIATAPTAGATSLSVTSATSSYDFPEDSYLVVKQNAYSFRLPQGTAEGQIMRWDNTAEEWVVYSGATDGHVLTWDTTNGWQAEAPAGGGSGISDGDYGDVTVSGGGTVINIDANVVGDAELRQGAAASVVGRFDSSVGNVADIVSSANHQILRRDDLGQLGWALIITDNISDSAVTTAKINNLAVTTGKLADDAVTTVKILDSNVTTAKINNLAVTTGKLADGAVTTVKIADANVTTAKIADSNVTTAKINNSAVTYAKMQNVTVTARVLGRKTAGAGVVEELSNTDLYTLLGLTGTANRFALWTGANTLNSDAAFTFNGARMTVTGTAAGVGANSGFLNLNSASITGATTFLRASGTINGNMLAEILNAHNASANSHTIFTIGTGGSSGGDPTLQFTVNTAVTHAMGIDNSDADKWKLTPNASLPGGNNNASFVATNEASPKYGFNRDAPEFTHDVGGRNRSDQYIGIDAGWVAGDVFFGSGAGTGPVFTSCFGTHNRLRLKFTTGTGPTANNVIFTLQYKAGFEFNNVGFPSLSAGNAATAGEITKFYVGNDNGLQFNIVANGALTASTPYELIITFSGY